MTNQTGSDNQIEDIWAGFAKQQQMNYNGFTRLGSDAPCFGGTPGTE